MVIKAVFLLLWFYRPLWGLARFFSFLILYKIGWTPWTGDQPVTVPYLHTEQHKHRINAHDTDIHASSGIRTHDPSVQASEDTSCLRPRGHCDRLWRPYTGGKMYVSHLSEVCFETLASPMNIYPVASTESWGFVVRPVWSIGKLQRLHSCL
jgi:hypothetical protein